MTRTLNLYSLTRAVGLLALLLISLLDVCSTAVAYRKSKSFRTKRFLMPPVTTEEGEKFPSGQFDKGDNSGGDGVGITKGDNNPDLVPHFQTKYDVVSVEPQGKFAGLEQTANTPLSLWDLNTGPTLPQVDNPALHSIPPDLQTGRPVRQSQMYPSLNNPIPGGGMFPFNTPSAAGGVGQTPPTSQGLPPQGVQGPQGIQFQPSMIDPNHVGGLPMIGSFQQQRWPTIGSSQAGGLPMIGSFQQQRWPTIGSSQAGGLPMIGSLQQQRWPTIGSSQAGRPSPFLQQLNQYSGRFPVPANDGGGYASQNLAYNNNNNYDNSNYDNSNNNNNYDYDSNNNNDYYNNNNQYGNIPQTSTGLLGPQRLNSQNGDTYNVMVGVNLMTFPERQRAAGGPGSPVQGQVQVQGQMLPLPLGSGGVQQQATSGGGSGLGSGGGTASDVNAWCGLVCPRGHSLAYSPRKACYICVCGDLSGSLTSGPGSMGLHQNNPAMPMVNNVATRPLDSNLRPCGRQCQPVN